MRGGARAGREYGLVIALQPPVDLIGRQDVLDVKENGARLTEGPNSPAAERLELAVGHGDDYGLVGAGLRGRDRDDAIFAVGRLGVDPGVMDVHLDAIALQFLDYVDDPGVAQVGAVFLEGEAEQQYAGAVNRDIVQGHQSRDLVGDVFAHVVVDAPAGQDHLGVEPDFLGLVGQVVRVNANAVATHQSGPERQEVPLAAGGGEDGVGVDVHFLEQHRQFVDQGDVDVALGVFDDLGGFGYPDRGRPMGAGRDDAPVQRIDEFGRFRGGAGGDFLDGSEPVFLVAGVDALRGVADEEGFCFTLDLIRQ